MLKINFLILFLFFQAFLFGQSHVVANFSFNNVTCANSAICFTDLSTSDNGQIVDWYWIWGDASTSSIQNPCHYYAEPATYTIVLKVTNANGDWDTITHSIIVNPTPSVTCQSNPDTLNTTSDTATLSAIASGGTPMYTYTWSPYNGLSSISDSTTKAIPNSSTCYTVTVKDANGCENTCSLCVIVNPTTNIDTYIMDHDKVDLYPNPNHGQMQLSYQIKQPSEFIITDVMGREVFKQTLLPQEHILNINSNLNNGLYLYSVLQNGEYVTVGKILVTK